jgi:hypothetical protein
MYLDKNGIPFLTKRNMDEMKRECNTGTVSTPRKSTPYPARKEKSDVPAKFSQIWPQVKTV